MNSRLWGVAVPAMIVGMSTIGVAAPASAHPHEASPAHQGEGQTLANGANHGPYTAGGLTCGGNAGVYGLETAHHGPDSGVAGNADGCYQLDSMPPGSDQPNPVIR